MAQNMAKKFPPSKSLNRKSLIKEPLTTIYIICEGATEKDYFEKLSAAKKNAVVVTDIVDKGGPILKLVEKCIALTEKLEKDAKKSKDSFANKFVVWGVPDVDEHPKFEEAKNLITNKKNLNIALSNPCFEVWGIFHYMLQDAHIHRHDAQKLLKTLMPGYCHEKNPYFDKKVIVELYETAMSNSKKAFKKRAEEKNERGNPSSSVHQLVSYIVNGEPESETDAKAKAKAKAEAKARAERSITSKTIS